MEILNLAEEKKDEHSSPANRPKLIKWMNESFNRILRGMDFSISFSMFPVGLVKAASMNAA